VKIRDAAEADIPLLKALKNPAALHRDRIREASSGEFRYLVVEDEHGRILGHACLVFSRPPAWPPDPEDIHYPRIIDLLVSPSNRRQGIGRFFVEEMKALCSVEYSRLFLSVDPQMNADALAFYESIGFCALESQPTWRHWSFRDSAGGLHQGEGWDLELFISL
jgi:GNAT superfamily N-acetyltransferase